MIVKWEGIGQGSFTLRDNVETCCLTRDGAGVRAEMVLRNGDEVLIVAPGSVFVMNDQGVTVDKLIVRH